MQGTPTCQFALETAKPAFHQTLLRSPAQVMLENLVASSLVLSEDWDRLSEVARTQMRECADSPVLLALLVEHGLLTEYQAGRISSGKKFGLLLGNYRILDRLGV